MEDDTPPDGPPCEHESPRLGRCVLPFAHYGTHRNIERVAFVGADEQWMIYNRAPKEEP